MSQNKNRRSCRRISLVLEWKCIEDLSKEPRNFWGLQIQFVGKRRRVSESPNLFRVVDDDGDSQVRSFQSPKTVVLVTRCRFRTLRNCWLSFTSPVVPWVVPRVDIVVPLLIRGESVPKSPSVVSWVPRQLPVPIPSPLYWCVVLWDPLLLVNRVSSPSRTFLSGSKGGLVFFVTSLRCFMYLYPVRS